MWKLVQRIPNRPAQLVTVQWSHDSEVRWGDHAGETLRGWQSLIGASAVEAFVNERLVNGPVVWRLFRGREGGVRELAPDFWTEHRIVVPLDEDVVRCIEDELKIDRNRSEVRWFLFDQPEMQLVAGQ